MYNGNVLRDFNITMVYIIRMNDVAIRLKYIIALKKDSVLSYSALLDVWFKTWNYIQSN